MSVLNTEENGQISIHHFLYHVSAVAWCRLCAGEQKNFDFLIIGKKQVKWVLGQIGRKQAGMTLVLQESFLINFTSFNPELLLKCIKCIFRVFFSFCCLVWVNTITFPSVIPSHPFSVEGLPVQFSSTAQAHLHLWNHDFPYTRLLLRLSSVSADLLLWAFFSIPGVTCTGDSSLPGNSQWNGSGAALCWWHSILHVLSPFWVILPSPQEAQNLCFFALVHSCFSL